MQKCPKLVRFLSIMDLIFVDKIPVQNCASGDLEKDISEQVQRVRNVRKLFFEQNRVKFVGTEAKLLANYNQLLQKEAQELDIEQVNQSYWSKLLRISGKTMAKLYNKQSKRILDSDSEEDGDYESKFLNSNSWHDSKDDLPGTAHERTKMEKT